MERHSKGGIIAATYIDVMAPTIPTRGIPEFG